MLCFSFVSALFHQPLRGEASEQTQFQWLIVLCSSRKHPLLLLLPASYCTVSQQKPDFNIEQCFVSACRPTQQKYHNGAP